MAADTEEKKGKGKKVKVENLDVEALEAAINKHFGPGTMKRGSAPELRITRIPTGSLAIDNLLNGGLARGRHAEIYGPAGIAKTTFSYKVIVEAQRMGGRAAFVDVERTFNPDFAGGLGMDLDELAYHEQVHGPRCIDFVETLLRSGLYDVIAIDSIAALVPLEDLETDMEKSSYGMQQAKMMSKALRKLTAVNGGQTAVVWLNQMRDSVGGMSFGPKSTTSGGRAMGFYGSTRLEFVKTETLVMEADVVDMKTGEITKKKRHPYGHRIQVKAVKEKTGARPMGETTIVFNYDRADFDKFEDLLYVGREFGFVHKKNNSWWVDEHEKPKAKSRRGFLELLEKHPAIASELEGWIRDNIGPEEDEEDDE